MSLSTSEAREIRNILNSKPVYAAVVKAYVGSNSKWRYSGIYGPLCIVNDANHSTYFLKLINSSNNSLVWEQEFYENFGYSTLNSSFHSVETDDQIVGFLFASKKNANKFFARVTSVSKLLSGGGGGGEVPKFSSTEVRQKEKSKKKKKLFSKLFKDKKNFVLSDPKQFRHESHIGWNPEKGFEVENIPAEWKRLFQMANIKKKELKDAETAQFLMNVVVDAVSKMEDKSDIVEDSQALSSPTLSMAPPMPPPPPPPFSIPANRPKPESRPPLADQKVVNTALNNDRSNLLSEIQSGTKLRSSNLRAIPDINKLDTEKATDLASILSKAMSVRRQDINKDESNNEKIEYSEESSSDWSS